MRERKRVLSAAMIIVGAAAASRAGTNHSYTPFPPFTGGEVIGLQQSADLWWANSFDAPAGGEFLVRLDASFSGGLPLNHPISLLVYEDPDDDGNPDDLVLVRRHDSTVQQNNSTALYEPQGFLIPPTYVSGKFFVAVQANNAPASAHVSVEKTNPQGRSFLAANTGSLVGSLDPAAPNAAELPPTNIDSLVGAPAPRYDFFIGARGRPTEFGRAQDPIAIDDFNTGDFTLSTNSTGTQVAAPGAVGGKRGASYTVVQGSGSVSVTDGKLTIANGQTSLFWGWENSGGTAGFSAGYGTYMHANLAGYDKIRIHFEQWSPFLNLSGLGLAHGRYTPDVNGNVDIPVSALGIDWTDVNTLSLTVYSHNSTTVIDSIMLLATPVPGDVNGDGNVGAEDYALIDRGFAMGLAGHVNGDLNGDGAVDAADYLALDTAFGQTGGLSPDLLRTRAAQFGDGYVAQLLAAVPEPSVGGITAVGLAAAARRRRSGVNTSR